ncbi:MAG: carboxypeptidase regulatory-like domain-containing protein [Chloracidobacterium sp.]|nr:carboxypeptidase regulatory-like domain-containing protein [Chloracidobacterium sp.]
MFYSRSRNTDRFLPCFLISIFALTGSVLAAGAGTTITGTVYDKQRNALVDVDVELMDEYRRTMNPGGRTKTDGAGRYQFSNIPDGYYTIRVMAFRYDFEDQERIVQLSTINIRGGEGTGYLNEDFYLIPKRGGMKEAELAVIFAQEIPKDAEDLFKKAEISFKNGRKDEGMSELQSALQVFPNYYSALHVYGRELLLRRRFMDAASVYMRAAEVNPKSATSFYNVGLALHSLGPDYFKAANTALEYARSLASNSVQVFWLSGKVARGLKNYADAEKYLLQAKKLGERRVPEVHKELAELYGNDLKNFAAAADELELYIKASKLDSKDEANTKQVIANLRKKATEKKGS